MGFIACCMVWFNNTVYPSKFSGPTGPEASQSLAFTFLLRDMRFWDLRAPWLEPCRSPTGLDISKLRSTIQPWQELRASEFMTHAPLGSIMYLHVAGWNTGLHIPVYNPSPTTTTLCWLIICGRANWTMFSIASCIFQTNHLIEIAEVLIVGVIRIAVPRKMRHLFVGFSRGPHLRNFGKSNKSSAKLWR